MKPFVSVMVLVLVLASTAFSKSIGIQTQSFQDLPGKFMFAFTGGTKHITAIGISFGFDATLAQPDIHQDAAIQSGTAAAELSWRQYAPGHFVYPYYGAALVFSAAHGEFPHSGPFYGIFGVAHNLRDDLRLELETHPFFVDVHKIESYQSVHFGLANSFPVYFGLTYSF